MSVQDYLKRSVWYLDSGCSRHMTWIKQYLHRYSKELGPKVVFGDDSSGDTKGKMENLNEVRVKELRSNNGTKFRNYKLEEFCDKKGEDLLISAISMCLGVPFQSNKHMEHLEKFDKKADDGFFLGYSLVAKAFSVFNIRRQEMEEIVHEPVISEDPPEFTKADNHPALNEPDQTESADLFEPAEPQNNVIIKPIIPQDRWSREKHIELVNIIGEPLTGITTRSRIRDSNAASASECIYVNFLSEMEPKKLIEALEEEGWIIAMQEELNQFERNKTVGHRIFLAYAAYMGFMVYQMDVKSAFLNGKISEEVYVQQPPGFESSEYPNHICIKLNLKESPYYAGCNLDRKSTLRGCQILGGKLVTWSAKKQSSVAMSSAEAEYVAVAGCYAQVLWIKSQLADYDVLYDKPLAEPNFTRLVAELDKPLSFTQDEFESAIGLPICKDVVPLPPKETERAGLATLSLFDKDKPTLLFTVLIDTEGIIFSDLVHKLQNRKKNRELNICYTRFLSLIFEKLLGKDYVSNDLTLVKPHTITAASFQKPLASEVPLTSHMLKVAKLSEEPEQSLIPPSEKVNADETADNSLSRASVQPITQSKATTDLKTKKKKIPPSSKQMATADATKSLVASKLAEEQGNQPSVAEAEK
ncbi:retrovirus-related pol polyprotein from transposon TNT 1-94, partial [Tanacetum coccineum]